MKTIQRGLGGSLAAHRNFVVCSVDAVSPLRGHRFLLPHDPRDHAAGPRCPYCIRGNMAFDAEEGIPGLFDYKCIACGKSDYEVLGADLERLCGFTRAQVENLTARGSLPVWVMDKRLLQYTQRSMKVSRAGTE